MSLNVHPDEIVESSKSGLLAKHPSWGRIRVGEFAEIKNGFAFKSKEFNTKGNGVPIVRIRDVGSAASETFYDGEFDDDYWVEPGDLLIGMDGDFRIARWRGPRSLLNQRVCRLRVVDPDQYNDRFLEHVLQGYLDAIHERTSSVTVKHLSSRTVAQIPVPQPALGEQERIVEVIEEQLSRLDAAVAALGRSLARVDSLRRLILRDAFSGRLSGGAEPGAGGVNHLPPGWERKPLGEAAEVILGQSPPGASYNDSGQGVPFFQGKAEFGSLYPTVMKWTTQPKKFANKGDVLISVRAPVGPTNLAPLDCSVGRGLAALRAPEGMPPKYLLYALRASVDALASRATGTTFAAVTGKQLRAHKIVVAPPDDQHRIVETIEEQFSRLEAGVAALGRSLARADSLRRSILRDAFSGRLMTALDSLEPVNA